MRYGEGYRCPICGKKTSQEYCEECEAAVSKSVDWLEDELKTDWDRVLDLLGYFYEKKF